MNMTDTTTKLSPAKDNARSRYVYLLVGHVFFLLGVIGIALPVVPTTIFWICAAACYLKSSPEKYQKIISHKRYGQTIARFIEHGVITKSGKKAASLGIALSALVTLLLPIGQFATILAIAGLLVAITFIWTRPAQIEAEDI